MANYGRGGRVAWPHLERVRLARPGQVDGRSESRKQRMRRNLEREILRALVELDHLASFTDNTPQTFRREYLMYRIREVLSAD